MTTTFTDEVRKRLECPVCYETRRNRPVFHCANGHLVCADCHEKVFTCPQCRTAMTVSARCLLAEDLIARLPVKCANWERGCGFESAADKDISAHAGRCRFRTVQCPHLTCRQTVLMADVVAHLKKEHCATVADKHGDSVVQLKFQPFLEEDSKVWAPVIIALKGATFVGVLSKSKKVYYTWVHALATNDDGGDVGARQEVEIALRGDRSTVSSVVSPMSMEDFRPEMMDDSDQILTFTNRQARQSLRRGASGKREILKIAYRLAGSESKREAPTRFEGDTYVDVQSCSSEEPGQFV